MICILGNFPPGANNTSQDGLLLCSFYRKWFVAAVACHWVPVRVLAIAYPLLVENTFLFLQR